MITAADVWADCAWNTPDGAAPEGYYLRDFFCVPGHEEFSSREEALEALREAYLGPDTDGVGVIIPKE